MKKDYTKYLAAAVGVIATTAIVAGATYAYQGDVNKKGPNFDPVRHEAMIEAIDNKDYSAWKELMGDKPVVEKITEENFDKFVEARQLMVEGKYEEAKALREELGLQDRRGFRKGEHGMRKGGEKFNKENFVAIQEAITNNDYEAWRIVSKDCPMNDQITEENFAKFAEVHNLKKAGKYEEAKVLWEELGLDFDYKKGFHRGQK